MESGNLKIICRLCNYSIAKPTRLPQSSGVSRRKRQSPNQSDPMKNTDSMKAVIRPLNMSKAITAALPTSNLDAMLKALDATKMFASQWDIFAGTAKVTHTQSNQVVLMAIEKTAGVWIISHHKMLFA